MKEQKVTIENQGQKIVGILHKSDKANDKLVILVTGFTGTMKGSGGIFIKLAKRLCKNGFDVFRFNFRFTTWDWSLYQNMTIKEEVSDLKKIISTMGKKYQKIGILGGSMGGAVSILSYNDKVDAMVFWYPSIFLSETDLKDKFPSKDKLKELENKGYIIYKKYGKDIKIGKNFVDEIRSLNLVPFLKKIESPILSVHGDKDQSVPIDQSIKLMKF